MRGRAELPDLVSARWGFRFELITLPPDGTPQSVDMDRAEALAETNKVLPGLMAVMDPDHPGWHSTDTIDLIYVASGACVLKLDSGEMVQLNAGDTLVQTARAMPGAIPAASPARC